MNISVSKDKETVDSSRPATEGGENTTVVAEPNQCMHRVVPRIKPEYRLFCFPYAGRGGRIYDSWSTALSERVELIGITFPGRSYRKGEAPYTRLSSVIQEVYDTMGPWLDLPYAFFGHCMGAVIAFEVAHLLEKNGHRAPFHLFASGTPAPQMPVYQQRPNLHDVSDDELTVFLERIGLLNQTTAAGNEPSGGMYALYRSDFEMMDTWTYTNGMKVNIPITAFGGADDMATTDEDVEAWQQVTDREFHSHIFPGEHFFVDSSLPELLTLINSVFTA